VQQFYPARKWIRDFSTVAALAGDWVWRCDSKRTTSTRCEDDRPKKKPSAFVAMVQGTSALESQAVSPETMRDLRERTINELLAGSNRKLWAD